MRISLINRLILKVHQGASLYICSRQSPARPPVWSAGIDTASDLQRHQARIFSMARHRQKTTVPTWDLLTWKWEVFARASVAFRCQAQDASSLLLLLAC